MRVYGESFEEYPPQPSTASSYSRCKKRGLQVKRLLSAVQAGWQAALDAWSSYAGNEWSAIESSVHDLERLRDVAADRFGQESKLFRQIDEALKNGGGLELETARQRFIEEAYEYLPPDVAPF
jgi:hypothetical protein